MTEQKNPLVYFEDTEIKNLLKNSNEYKQLTKSRDYVFELSKEEWKRHVSKYKFDFWTYSQSNWCDLDMSDDSFNKPFSDMFIELVGSFQEYHDVGGDTMYDLYRNPRDGSYHFGIINQFNQDGYFPPILMKKLIKNETKTLISSVRSSEDKTEMLELLNEKYTDCVFKNFDQTSKTFIKFIVVNFLELQNSIKLLVESINIEDNDEDNDDNDNDDKDDEDDEEDDEDKNVLNI